VRFVTVIRARFDGDAYAFLPALLAVTHLKQKNKNRLSLLNLVASRMQQFVLTLGMMVGGWRAHEGQHTASSTEFEV
jgi:hypothetical protein